MIAVSKFDELRMKTERELVQLVERELDVGMREARQVPEAETPALAEEHFLTAQRAYAEVSRLIPLVEETSDVRRQLEEQVRYFGKMIDGLSILGSRTTEHCSDLASLVQC